jgi:hypothetical protein
VFKDDAPPFCCRRAAPSVADVAGDVAVDLAPALGDSILLAEMEEWRGDPTIDSHLLVVVRFVCCSSCCSIPPNRSPKHTGTLPAYTP